MNADPPRLQPVVAALLERHPADRAIDLTFGECVIRVRSNAPPLLDRLGSDYRAFVGAAAAPTFVITALQTAPPELPGPFTVRPSTSPRGPKEEWCEFADGRAIRKLRTGMVFLVSGPHQVAVGDCLTNFNQIINFVNSRYLNWLMRAGGLLLHAAGVSHRDAGVAITGFPGAGKSTLALHLIRGGLDFVSNDRLVMRRTPAGLRMDGLPKHPRVNPGTILNNPALIEILPPERRRALDALPAGALWSLEEKYDVVVPDRFGAKRTRPGAVARGLYVLNWKRTDEAATIRPVELGARPDLLPAIMKSRGVFADGPVELADGSTTADEYVAGLRECPTFEVIGGVQFDAVARHCSALLGVT